MIGSPEAYSWQSWATLAVSVLRTDEGIRENVLTPLPPFSSPPFPTIRTSWSLAFCSHAAGTVPADDSLVCFLIDMFVIHLVTKASWSFSTFPFPPVWTLPSPLPWKTGCSSHCGASAGVCFLPRVSGAILLPFQILIVFSDLL